MYQELITLLLLHMVLFTYFTYSDTTESSATTFGFIDVTDLRRTVLNQPPSANMLPIVRVPANCPTVLQIPS